MSSLRVLAVAAAVGVGCSDDIAMNNPTSPQLDVGDRGRSATVLVTGFRLPGSVAIGGSLHATGTSLPSLPLIWVSETPGVATVSEDGTITGVNAGATLVRASILPPS